MRTRVIVSLNFWFMIGQDGPEDMSGKGLKCPGGTSVQKDHQTGDINARSKGCRGKQGGNCPPSLQMDQQGRKRGLVHGTCYIITAMTRYQPVGAHKPPRKNRSK